MRERLRKLLQGRALDWARLILLPLALAVAIGRLGVSYHAHYPIQEWLIWRYLGYWLACALFSVACVSAGQRVLRFFGRSEEGLRAELVISFGLGVLVFFWGVFLLGLVGLLRRPTFFLLPIALLLSGGRPALRFAQRCARAVRSVKARRKATALGRTFGFGAALVGIAAILILYAQILPPENVSFDARWYHLGIAEQYVSEGAIRRFPEGAHFGAYPQLASLLYAWAFLEPTGLIFDRVLVAAHLEFTLFLWTLAGVSVLVHRLVPRQRPRFAWVAVFLFPGLFVYDSSLICGADHVLAFFGPLIFFAFLRAWSAPSARTWFLVAAFISGALLTKYTAVYLALFPLLALVGLCVVKLAVSLRQRKLDRAFWRAPIALAAGGLAITAPHWLKNWIWYGNPVYPMAAGIFKNRPWSEDAERAVALRDLSAWSPQGTLGARLKETIEALYSFSFKPHDYPKMHGLVPVFGSLFTLCVLALPFLKGAKRAWALCIAANLGVFCWYWTHHEDRYLQALVPWMAAFVAAALALAWSSNVIAKIGVAALVGLQLAWGGDLPFIPVHAMVRGGVLDASLTLLASGYKKEYAKRLDVFSDGVALSKALPPDAHVLLHEFNPRLGINRPVVTDVPFIQGALHYGPLAGPKALYDRVRGLGVTHVIWLKSGSRGADSFASDFVFFDFLTRYTTGRLSVGRFWVARLTDGPDEDGQRDDVLYLGCKKTFEQGVYKRLDIHIPMAKKARPKPRTPLPDVESASKLAEGVRYVVFEPKCFTNLPGVVGNEFVQAGTRSAAQLWVRKPAGGGDRPPTPAPSPAAPADLDAPVDPLANPGETE